MFSECPHLHESVVLKKSDNCTNTSLGQQFAPGCVCTVGCSWEVSFSIRCGQDLQWSSLTNIPSACNVPAPRTQTATSQAPREHGGMYCCGRMGGGVAWEVFWVVVGFFGLSLKDSTHKGVNWCLQAVVEAQQQRPELPLTTYLACV